MQGDNLIHVPVTELRPSPTNPRTDFGDMESLAKDIERRGILQPLVARERDGCYEVTLGGRRLKAAQILGLDNVPVIVREESDQEVLEAQIVENAQREDIHPIDEAEAYQALQRDHGYTIEGLAERFLETARHVRERCKLLALTTEVRALFRDGAFSVDIAFLIARISDPGSQRNAAKEIAAGGWEGEPFSLREARRMIRDEYMLELRNAPFPADDAELLEKAPACTACPNRSGAQQVLFAELADKDDYCLNPPCFKEKTDANWKRARAAARKDGQKVLTDKQSKKVFPYRSETLAYNGEYVDAEERCLETGGKKSWKKVLGKHAPTPVVARDPTGRVRHLYPASEAKKALKNAGHPKAGKTESDEGAKATAAEEKKTRKRKLKAADIAIARIVESPPVLGSPAYVGAKAVKLLAGLTKGEGQGVNGRDCSGKRARRVCFANAGDERWRARALCGHLRQRGDWTDNQVKVTCDRCLEQLAEFGRLEGASS